MGTIPFDEDRVLRGSDRKTFLVETFTDTASVSHPEEGCVWCNIREKGTREAAFSLTVCYADWKETWYERWLEAFASLPAYREKFRVRDGQDWVQHPSVTVELLGAGFVQIDELLAPAIRKLNDLGCITHASCQGIDSQEGKAIPTADAPCAYIALAENSPPLPTELIRAWEGAGFYTDRLSVYANAPFGLLGTAAHRFIESLRDWMSGTLDESGTRYVMTTERKSSLPPVPVLPPTVAEAKQQKAIKALLRLGKKARFKDFAALRSGTDQWSKMRLAGLQEALGDQFSHVANSGLPEEQQARHARWILRGLPADLALRKVKTDMEIAENARPSSRAGGAKP